VRVNIKPKKIAGLFVCVLISVVISSCSGNSDQANEQGTESLPENFGFGRKASNREIDSIDIDITPDGHGLPQGSGTIAVGEKLFELKCFSCHSGAGPYAKLIGAMGDTVKAKTIGNYWPYATTVFDYIRRTMPFNAPGSLTNDEVYSLTAFLLYKNRIIDSVTVLNSSNLANIEMPAKKLFVNDDRKGGKEVR